MIEETRIVTYKYVGKQGRNHMAELLCTCGNKKTVALANIKSGKTRSCGCLRSETVAQLHKNNTVHGACDSSEYYVWQSMIQRCTNATHPDYADYGGRGITVCPTWRKSFVQFFSDMGPKGVVAYTLERVDNNQGYSKDNCIWADVKTQANNRRPKNHATIQG